VSRPRPVPTDLTEPFWAAVGRGELVIARCQTCGRWEHPPFPVCPQCYGTKFAFEAVAGTGTIHSMTILTADLDPRFAEIAPLAVIAAELDEQPGLIVVGNVLGADPGSVRIGARCAVEFERIDDAFSLPQFRLTEDNS
jgi:uncharacterized protein